MDFLLTKAGRDSTGQTSLDPKELLDHFGSDFLRESTSIQPLCGIDDRLQCEQGKTSCRLKSTLHQAQAKSNMIGTAIQFNSAALIPCQGLCQVIIPVLLDGDRGSVCSIGNSVSTGVGT